MKKNYLFILFFLVLSIPCLAQKEASHWYFGNRAGLDFSSGVPVADTNGALSTTEGCATISDIGGNLLFYTDGRTVWNKNHDRMPSGNGLLGNSSSSQSAIIVPKPDDSTIYYIFTVDWSGGESGLNYYTVDMTLNGGLGDVVGTNNSPDATLLLASPVTEKITAVKVKDKEAFWVITSKDGRFNVFKVDEKGVQTTPVAGNTGFINPEDFRGYLKTSPDGKLLVSANMSSGTFLYDFDSATGKVSNQRRLNLSGAFGYGVEFSPLSKKLYVSTGNFGRNGPYEELLLQFRLDMSLPTELNINASRFELHRYINSRAALQVGLDGKIYRTIDNSAFLGVINNPDGDATASDYRHEAISLGGKFSTQGLPPFIQSFFAALITTENLCLGNETKFSIESNEPIISIKWDFGDGSTSTNLEPAHVYASTGDYVVNVDVTTVSETKTITQTISIFEVPAVNTPVDLFQCDDDTDGFTNFNLKEAIPLMVTDATDLTIRFYQNSADATEGNTVNIIQNSTQFSNTQASKVYARVENIYGCEKIVEVNLKVSSTTIPSGFTYVVNECDNGSDGDDTNGFATFNFSHATQEVLKQLPAAQNLEVSYYETMEDGLAEANAINPESYTNTTVFSQKLVVRIENEDNNNCLGLGYFVTLQVNALPEFELAEEAFVCINKPSEPVLVTVENPQDVYNYRWTDNNDNNLPDGNNSFYNFTEAGIYKLTAFNTITNCSRTKSIVISASNIAAFEDFQVEDATENNTVTVNVSGEGDYEYALDDASGPYQDSNIFENVTSGIHTIYIRDKKGCGTIEEEVSVIGFPKFFTPNGDGFNDTWQIDGVSFQPNSLIYIFDRFGKVLAKIDPQGEGWNGRYRGKLLPESDYWFKVKLEDGRTLKGNFSLIRR
ncbi:T9SS type B sorting domain-containing protein [Aureibaculum sp. 2210JD6-5]|uniref:T9SS type B sorting domain-containing protein n=1 Tax=Aureibaculum sp. 2210JD6-5 TaxID=3103957 RepID=UPI002AAE3DF4|nr:T9SS type B sorting domain-containing protein [Aureibaculum sp. 2210JD6-5]MDY7396244.1 T9SS type B sorting domain-containing protein [Aureibaculum sp. 2210JD6-5]